MTFHLSLGKSFKLRKKIVSECEGRYIESVKVEVTALTKQCMINRKKTEGRKISFLL